MKGNRGGGGARPGAGRKPNVPNKVSRELAAAAREYTEEALLVAVKVMRGKKVPPGVKLTAVEIILNRGYGKPPQAINLNRTFDLTKCTDEELEVMERIAARTAGAGNNPDGAAAEGVASAATNSRTQH